MSLRETDRHYIYDRFQQISLSRIGTDLALFMAIMLKSVGRNIMRNCSIGNRFSAVIVSLGMLVFAWPTFGEGEPPQIAGKEPLYTNSEYDSVVSMFEQLANRKDLKVEPEYFLFFLSKVTISAVPELPPDYTESIRAGIDQFNQENYVPARTEFFSAEKRYPHKTIFPGYFLALTYVETKELMKAERLLLDLLKAKPDFVQASSLLRRIRLRFEEHN